MDDECLITRDEGSVDDAVLDQDPSSPTFGELIQAPEAAKYEGKCSLKAPSGLSNRPQEEGGQIYTQGEYELSLPISYLEDNPDAEPLKGDWVLFLTTRRDPALVGKKFRIIDVTYKTMAVSRKCALELRA